MRHRKAFVFLPLVILLALSAATLGIIHGLNAPVKQTTSAAYNQGNRLGQTIGVPIFALLLVCAAGWLAERKGDGPANAIFGSILLLMNIAVGFNVYRVTIGKPTPQPAVAGAGAPIRGQPPSAPSPAQPRPPRPAPVLDPSAPNPGPAPSRTPTQASPEPIPARSIPAGPTKEQVDAEATSKPVIADFRERLESELKEAADAAEGFVAKVLAPPAHDKRVLKDRTADAEALSNLLTRVKASLDAADESLQKELVAAGLDEFAARQAAAGFRSDLNAHSKKFACDRLIDLCERVKAESRALDSGFAAWTLVGGEIKVKDPMRRHELTSERFFIESACRQASELLRTLAD